MIFNIEAIISSGEGEFKTGIFEIFPLEGEIKDRVKITQLTVYIYNK